MHFISSNLLYDFLNDKYMFFYKINLKKKKKSCEKYGSTPPDPQPESVFNPLKMTVLTRNPINLIRYDPTDLTRPFCPVYRQQSQWARWNFGSCVFSIQPAKDIAENQAKMIASM